MWHLRSAVHILSSKCSCWEKQYPAAAHSLDVSKPLADSSRRIRPLRAEMQHSSSSVQGFIMTLSKHPSADICVYVCFYSVCLCPVSPNHPLSLCWRGETSATQWAALLAWQGRCHPAKPTQQQMCKIPLAETAGSTWACVHVFGF